MIYLDNGATSWPKPSTVIKAMEDFLVNWGGNPGRSGHSLAVRAGKAIWDTRVKIAGLLGCNNPERIIFTLNATDSLNMAIKGLLEPGDHAIISSMEHNSVYRPVAEAGLRGVKFDIAWADEKGYLDPDKVKKLIKKTTKLIALTHCSNVTGTIMPIKEIGLIAKNNGIVFLVDGAQSVGTIPINVSKEPIDILAFPGHKSLMGPPGTGGLYLKEGVQLKPFRVGGTGSLSESEFQPEELPDRYESGTPNTVGIVGLGAALDFINDIGIENIKAHEERLLSYFLDKLKEIEGITIYGPCNVNLQGPVISLNINGFDSTEAAAILDGAFNIATRPGLHCAPLAHKTIGTFNGGTLRLSIGYFNTKEDIDKTICAINAIVKGK